MDGMNMNREELDIIQEVVEQSIKDSDNIKLEKEDEYVCLKNY